MNNFNKISEAIKYIDKNLNDTLSVELIAEHFAFSPYFPDPLSQLLECLRRSTVTKKLRQAFFRRANL